MRFNCCINVLRSQFNFKQLEEHGGWWNYVKFQKFAFEVSPTRVRVSDESLKLRLSEKNIFSKRAFCLQTLTIYGSLLNQMDLLNSNGANIINNMGAR